MSAIIIRGGRPLSGSLTVQGAKNSVLPILAATLLSGEVCRIRHCPRLRDVETAMEILRHLGCRADWQGRDLLVDAADLTRWDVPDHLMSRMRSSVVFLGAIQRIAGVTEKLVPVMAALYLLGGLVVLVCRVRYLPEAVGMIFRYAFVPNAIIGGSVGSALKMAVSQGVKRGLFSNEAGMGSTPHAHAMAKVKHPHEQGVVAMTGVFIDTFVVLTMTALVVISTLYAGNGILSAGTAEGVSKANMAQMAFGTVLGSRAGSMFVAVCLLFFAFSTILSWNFFGRLNVSWLLGEKAVGVYSVLAIGFIFLGSCLSNDLVWELADLFNQLMVLPNVLALVTLGGLVAAACRRK